MAVVISGKSHHLTDRLGLRLGKRYPYSVPNIEFAQVKGLASNEQTELMSLVVARAKECATIGCVMMIELVQIVEDYLVKHNHDPNLSAWEQMKIREARELEERHRKVRERDEMVSTLLIQDSSRDEYDDGIRHGHQFHAIGGEVKKEFARQAEALRIATLKGRQGDYQYKVSSENVNKKLEEEDDEEEDDADEYEGGKISGPGSSRYRSDFIELGLLGRGGGGEVVKVRNRLDRRIYAVKKIILESEQGRYAQVGAIQNRKLKREVVTISRITHKNIVRYYQAWVEGDENVDSVEEGKETDKNNIIAPSQDIDGDEDSNSQENKGWWMGSDFTDDIISGSLNNIEAARLIESISEAWNNAEVASNGSELSLQDQNDASDFMVDLQNPLFSGIGVQNKAYTPMIKSNKRSEKSSNDDHDSWDESSVKVDSTLGQRILYIQMEYCSTTLRKVIDEGNEKPLLETEKFRIVRQIVEALVYLHGENLIHRDLVSSGSCYAAML
jgi:eukaryotic translation initiation factor 2-alpha kinase 4